MFNIKEILSATLTLFPVQNVIDNIPVIPEFKSMIHHYKINLTFF